MRTVLKIIEDAGGRTGRAGRRLLPGLQFGLCGLLEPSNARLHRAHARSARVRCWKNYLISNANTII